MANKIDYRLDENGLAHLWQRIKLLVTNNVSSKVDKVDGKGLSTNDYTNAEKTKLAGIADGAQKNVQPDWSLTSGDGAIKNKPTIPTKVSELTNDSGYQTNSEVNTKIGTELGKLNYDVGDEPADTDLAEYFLTGIIQTNGKIRAKKANYSDAWDYAFDDSVSKGKAISATKVKEMLNSAVGQITSFEYKVVDSLPAVSEGKKGTIYLVAHRGSTAQNIYDEYIFLSAEGSTEARYEKIGTTDIDLTPYAKKTEIPTKLSQLSNDQFYISSGATDIKISTAIEKLDYSDTAVAGQYVSSVSETDGVISVARANFADAIPAITETQIDNICTF